MKNERRRGILSLVSKNRKVKANELVEIYNVSMETIRRDLEYLEEMGFLTREYGGAVAKTMNGLEPDYSSREIKNYEEKMCIGKAAAKLVEDGDTIIIDVGTTTRVFAKFLREQKNITVFTNAIPIAMELADDKNIHVVVLGGTLRAGEFSTSGFLAENDMDQFNVDKVFLGVGGLTDVEGISDYHIEEANLRRHYIKSAHKVIALADYSKFGVKALNKVCASEKIDVVVTDGASDKQMLQRMREKGIKIIIGN